MAGFVELNRRGRLDTDTDLEMDRDGSGEDNTVMGIPAMEMMIQ